jgi:fucose permease
MSNVQTPAPSLTGKDQKASKGISPIYIIGGLFFVFGFITWLNSVLIPYLKIACQPRSLFSGYLILHRLFINGLSINPTAKKNGLKKRDVCSFGYH